MSALKLKNSIILKQVNAECVFAIDCESEEDSFFKFENASKFFLETLHQGADQQEIIDKSIAHFSGVDKKQIEEDFNEFLQMLEEFGIIQH